MELNYYQAQAFKTASKFKSLMLERAVWGLGIAGEAGEVADLIKKEVGHEHTTDRDKMVKELGDVLWYTAMVAKAYNISLDEVAITNVAKLRERYPAGFDPERSKNREEG